MTASTSWMPRPSSCVGKITCRCRYSTCSMPATSCESFRARTSAPSSPPGLKGKDHARRIEERRGAAHGEVRVHVQGPIEEAANGPGAYQPDRTHQGRLLRFGDAPEP